MGFEEEKFRLAECTAYQAGLYRETLFICLLICVSVHTEFFGRSGCILEVK